MRLKDLKFCVGARAAGRALRCGFGWINEPECTQTRNTRKFEIDKTTVLLQALAITWEDGFATFNGRVIVSRLNRVSRVCRVQQWFGIIVSLPYHPMILLLHPLLFIYPSGTGGELCQQLRQQQAVCTVSAPMSDISSS